MKKAIRIVAVIMALCILASSAAFGANAGANIVSPASNAVISNDSLLVSVKVADKNKIRVTVFAEKIYKGLDKDGKYILQAVDTNDASAETLASILTAYNDTKTSVEDAKYTLGAVTGSFFIGEDETKVNFKDVVVAIPVTYTSASEIGYFSKKVENLSQAFTESRLRFLTKTET